MLRVCTFRARGAVRSFRGLTAFAYRAAAFCVAASLLNLPAAFASARPAAAAGAITAVGGVTIDGSPAVSGQTLFSGSSVATARGAQSAIDLDNLARLELSAEATMKLNFSDSGVGGALDSGRARVSVPHGVRADVTTRDASVTTGDDRPSVFSVQVERDGTTVSVHSGRVEMRAGDFTQTLDAGQALSTARGLRPLQAQGQSLTDGERAGVIVGIAGVIAVIIIAITGRNSAPPIRECGPIVPSGQTDNPC